MKKVSLAVLISLSALTGAAYAQSENGIMMSTDPQKAADIEQRAQDLQQRQEAAQSQMPMKEDKKMHHHHKKPAQ